MRIRGRNMLQVTTKVKLPTNWPNIKTAYAGITEELNHKGTPEQKLAAIYYWQQRLLEDAGLVAQGLAPAVAPSDNPPA
jgi:hypothetical protein